MAQTGSLRREAAHNLIHASESIGGRDCAPDPIDQCGGLDFASRAHDARPGDPDGSGGG